MNLRSFAVSLVVGLAVMLVWPQCGVAMDDLPYWPSEQEARLQELDAKTLELQSLLFQARMSGDQAEVERLAPVYQNVKVERLKLLKAVGRL